MVVRSGLPQIAPPKSSRALAERRRNGRSQDPAASLLPYSSAIDVAVPGKAVSRAVVWSSSLSMTAIIAGTGGRDTPELDARPVVTCVTIVHRGQIGLRLNSVAIARVPKLEPF